MLRQAGYQQGVSLIELMIGLVVMAILMAIAAPSFTGYIQNTHVRNAAEGIQNGLNLARAEAVRRNTNVQFQLGDDFSWTVGCEVSGDTDGDGVDDCPATISSKPAAEGSSKASVATSEIVTATGVPLTTPAFTNKLVFNGFGKEQILPPTDAAVFDISNPSAGACLAADGSGKVRCLRVMVTPAGQVRMCDPLLSAGNPQAC